MSYSTSNRRIPWVETTHRIGSRLALTVNGRGDDGSSPYVGSRIASRPPPTDRLTRKPGASEADRSRATSLMPRPIGLSKA